MKLKVNDHRTVHVYVDGLKLEFGRTWNVSEGHLRILGDEEREVATYAPGAWTQVGYHADLA